MIAGAALADDIQKFIWLCYLDAAQHGDPAGEESLRQHAGGGPGDDQQIGLGDALRRLSTAIVAALVRVLPSMTFVWFFQLSSIKRSEV